MTDARGYFERTGTSGFVPTRHTGGAWADDEQHVSPLCGLLVHEIERARVAEGRPPLILGRVTFDILGKIGRGGFDISVEVLRPGRTIELMQATAIIDGRPVVSARAWYMLESDTVEVAGGHGDPLPEPDAVAPWAMTEVWPGGFIESVDTRAVRVPEPGRGTTWISSPLPLVDGEDVSDVAAFVGMVDTANGIAVRENPRAWMFPNLDLTIHFFRTPVGRWAGLDTTVHFGPTGQGLTSTVLHDVHGTVGRAAQSLTVRPLPPE